MRKTVFDRSALTFIGVVCLLAIIVSSFKIIRLHNVKCPDIKILVSTPDVVENTPFTVSFVSPGVSSWDWNFGDNTPHGNSAKVNHVYRTAGKYTLILTVNGSEKCNTSMLVVVEQDRSATSSSSLDAIESSIEGPSTAVVGKPVKFHETSGKGTTWQWTSSESNGIDGTGQEITYTFTSPGKKTIYVNINGSKGRASVDVDVKAATGGGGAKPKTNEAMFRDMLTQVINRKKDASVFSDALCGNLKLQITIMEKGKGKLVAFEEFCRQMKKDNSRTEIDELKLTIDAKGCVTGVVIKEHPGKWAPFR